MSYSPELTNAIVNKATEVAIAKSGSKSLSINDIIESSIIAKQEAEREMEAEVKRQVFAKFEEEMWRELESLDVDVSVDISVKKKAGEKESTTVIDADFKLSPEEDEALAETEKLLSESVEEEDDESGIIVEDAPGSIFPEEPDEPKPQESKFDSRLKYEEIIEELDTRDKFMHFIPMFISKAKDIGSQYKADEIEMYANEISEAKYDADGNFVSDRDEQGEMSIDASMMWGEIHDGLEDALDDLIPSTTKILTEEELHTAVDRAIEDPAIIGPLEDLLEELDGCAITSDESPIPDFVEERQSEPLGRVEDWDELYIIKVEDLIGSGAEKEARKLKQNCLEIRSAMYDENGDLTTTPVSELSKAAQSIWAAAKKEIANMNPSEVEEFETQPDEIDDMLEELESVEPESQPEPEDIDDELDALLASIDE